MQSEQISIPCRDGKPDFPFFSGSIRFLPAFLPFSLVKKREKLEKRENSVSHPRMVLLWENDHFLEILGPF